MVNYLDDYEEFQVMFPRLYKIMGDKIYLDKASELGSYGMRKYFKSRYLGLRTDEDINVNDWTVDLLEMDLHPGFIMDGKEYPQGGTITMGNDFKLSDQACAFFYSYNIVVRYIDDQNDVTLYDRDMITRRHIINEIIK